MPLYRSNTPSCSQLEVAALVTEPSGSLNPELQNENSFAFLKPATVHKDDPGLLLNKAVKKRSGMGVAAKATESTFSSLLQPILALFPPTQTATPLAPAFELKLPNSPKGNTGKHDDDPLVKAKSLTHADDENAFVIYQPASWATKRSKPTAARMARTFDWRTDVFGPSPNAVYGQRTKYPKPSVPPRLLREVGPVTHHSALLASMVRDRAGSLTSVSDASSISFASTGEDGMETQPITPPHCEALGDMPPFLQEHAAVKITLENDLLSLESLASPSGAVAERFSKMGVISPFAVEVSAREEENVEVVEEEMHSGSTPFTPPTPREIPDSDEESDDE